MKEFEFLEHTADVKFRAYGKSLEEVFKNSALAMKEVLSEDSVEKKIKKEIGTQIDALPSRSKGKGTRGEDLVGVLRSFLEEILYLLETEDFLLSEIRNMVVEEKSGAYFISCELLGDKPEKYEIKNHIKAVTYNDMFVRKEDKWIAQVVLDV